VKGTAGSVKGKEKPSEKDQKKKNKKEPQEKKRWRPRKGEEYLNVGQERRAKKRGNSLEKESQKLAQGRKENLLLSKRPRGGKKTEEKKRGN